MTTQVYLFARLERGGKCAQAELVELRARFQRVFETSVGSVCLGKQFRVQLAYDLDELSHRYRR
ncbi:hypothetical protein ACIBG0_23440 [Nocardia sp. NPDC050630]|uniref:hypothetical protein n=1 Tax=Nocardia sp. NPDC050630 TaxID=3364321 RepID=UPI0037ABBC22